MMKKPGYLKYSLLLVVALLLVGCPPYAVTILTPSDGAIFVVGDEITFTGSAMDPLEGELSGTSLVWTSDQDGDIGTGKEVKKSDLSDENHTITLTATNSQGLEETATISITISDAIIPTTTTTTVDATTTTTIVTTTTTIAAMKLESQAFAEGATIPVKYTCDGTDTSPDLNWSNEPLGTKSFVLIMDDPDAPGGTWDHWVVFDIPSTTKSVQEGQEPQGTKGKNSWGTLGYRGPCPPSGTHHYNFTIYALDVDTLSLAEGATKSEVETNIVGHILDQASLMGTYG
jgi:Raf kinase inhibitor-like YbhB/YbcL family protein